MTTQEKITTIRDIIITLDNIEMWINDIPDEKHRNSAKTLIKMFRAKLQQLPDKCEYLDACGITYNQDYEPEPPVPYGRDDLD